MNNNDIRRPAIDWSRAEERARGMTLTELRSARRDAYAAGEAAWLLERKGELLPSAKDQGYYMDECSVYAAEQHAREAGDRDRRKARAYGKKWARNIDIARLIEAGPEKIRAVLAGAASDGWQANTEERNRA